MRVVGCFVVLGSLGALLAGLVLAAPGDAQTTEKEYVATFEPTCVVAPGVLNIKSKVKVTTRAMGPAEVSAGEAVSFHGASSTITSPTELTEAFSNLGANEVKGTVLNFALDGSGLEPDRLNVAKPSEYPQGLPFYAPVEKGKEEVFNIPSLKLGETGLTYTFGPETVTARSGNVVATVDDSPGFTETEPGYYNVDRRRNRDGSRRPQGRHSHHRPPHRGVHCARRRRRGVDTGEPDERKHHDELVEREHEQHEHEQHDLDNDQHSIDEHLLEHEHEHERRAPRELPELDARGVAHRS